MQDRMRTALLFLSVTVALWCALAVSCSGTLPSTSQEADSYARPQDKQWVRNAIQFIDTTERDPDESAFLMLNHGEEALRWRLAMIDNAKQTLDLQYYMWHHDAVGTLLLSRVLKAAQRGVRVRLILDDTSLAGSHKGAAVLSSHPNFEIRAFNPFVESTNSKVVRLFELAGDFARLNHRMHNKLLIVDNVMAIIGGRNIGDEYCGLRKSASFRDMDVVGLGPIAADVSEAFDMYWNSDWAVPPKTLLRRSRGAPSPEQQRRETEKAREKYPQYVRKIESELEKHRSVLSAFGPDPKEHDRLVAVFRAHARLGKATVAVDTPPTEEGQLADQVARQVGQLLRSATEQILIVTPYLVPTRRGIDLIRSLTDRGLQVRILTNSLASNDVIPAHTAYAPYREPLVEAGVELHELHAKSDSRAFYSTAPVQMDTLALHAKVVIVDRRRVFVGTMNLDPRSMVQNTEVGTIIDSPELAEDLLQAFSRDLQTENSWLVHYDEDGFIQFKSGDETTYLQPALNLWQRLRGWLAPGPAFESQI